MTHEEFDSIAALDAIGAATAAESGALRMHVAACEPCRRARDAYAEAATLLAYDVPPVEPPPDVRERVLAQIAPRTARPSTPWWLAVAACLFLALWGWRELGIRVARENAVSQQAELERLRNDNARLSAELASLAGPDTRAIALTGQEIAPTASAKVFLEPSRRRAVVFFHNLPRNPNDKSYQLWIIRADQPQPVSAGVFDAKDGMATISIDNLPLETEIKALAVTLEPRGGVASPTNTQFYVAGEI